MPSETVTIEKLVSGGAGLARTGDGIVFVNDVVPGETVAIERIGRKGGVPVARPVGIVAPSPARRDPPCTLSGCCGGCDWLHIVYKEQLAAKLAIVTDCMRRIGRINELPAFETIAADEFAYRHRAQFKIDSHGCAGFFKRHTNEVVPVSRCPLLVDPLNDLLSDLSDRKIMLPSPEINLMVMAGDNGTVASFPRIDGRTSDAVVITAGNKTFDVPANGFFQSNRPLLHKLGTWASDHVQGDWCIDLYGGLGFFSILLADHFRHGLLIESAGALVASAKLNFKRNGITHFEARESMAENLLSIAGQRAVDCLIVDPPRPGLTRKVREAIAAIKPAAVLYVSCNPSTQARDLGFLINKASYAVSRAAVIDLYPNTHHIESLVLLTQNI